MISFPRNILVKILGNSLTKFHFLQIDQPDGNGYGWKKGKGNNIEKRVTKSVCVHSIKGKFEYALIFTLLPILYHTCGDGCYQGAIDYKGLHLCSSSCISYRSNYKIMWIYWRPSNPVKCCCNQIIDVVAIICLSPQVQYKPPQVSVRLMPICLIFFCRRFPPPNFRWK